MRKITIKLRLDRETIRMLSLTELGAAGGGRPTGYGTDPCAGAQLRGTTSEAQGAGPCPGEYSWTCNP